MARALISDLKKNIKFLPICLTAVLTWLAAWQYYSNADAPKSRAIVLFDEFSCRPFIVIYDPELEPIPPSQTPALKIPLDGVQAVRVPKGTTLLFSDVNGNGVYKTELQIGSAGYQEKPFDYSVLALGKELPCGREQLQYEEWDRVPEFFEKAIILKWK